MEYAWLGLQENYQKLNLQLRFKLSFFFKIVFVLYTTVPMEYLWKQNTHQYFFLILFLDLQEQRRNVFIYFLFWRSIFYYDFSLGN